MPLNFLDPCTDSSWDAQVAEHPRATPFHGSAWARVLQDTYRHRPFYARMRAGDDRPPALLPLMEVRSWLTGHRGVSLPFTDECNVSGDRPGPAMFEALCELGRSRGWQHLEFRGGGMIPLGATPSSRYLSHCLDLTVGLPALEKGMSSSALGATRKAKSSGVKAAIDHSLEGMRSYYALHTLTRRRHGLPPQSWRFFRNIHRHLVSHGQGFVSLATLEGQAIAGAVYFCGSGEAVYKFSASDAHFQALRPANLVMSTALEHIVALGCQFLHFGRTDTGNVGLQRFKRAWGAQESSLEYYRYDLRRAQWVTRPDRVSGAHNAFFRRMPATLNRALGALLYPHLD